jgi:hypothetical protein
MEQHGFDLDRTCHIQDDEEHYHPHDVVDMVHVPRSMSSDVTKVIQNLAPEKRNDSFLQEVHHNR